MTAIRTILAPFLLCFQLLMVAGGPVVAQYCCGQRVELEAECAQESCCTEIDACCEDEGADASEMCCDNDVELKVEFTQICSLDAAVAPSSIQAIDPPVAMLSSAADAPMAVYATELLYVADDVGQCEPPDPTILGVWRL